MNSHKQGETRRDFLRMLVAVPIVLGVPSLMIRDTHVLKDPSDSKTISTPARGNSAPAQTEGPSFENRSKERKPMTSPRFV
jgi:hypothetical protein